MNIRRIAAGCTVAILLGLGLPAYAEPATQDWSAKLNSNATLTLSDLIEIAIATHPELVELRGDLNVALAKERAEHDWEDPELRIRFRRDNDVELPPTERETRTSVERESENGTNSENSTRLDGAKTENRSTTGRSSSDSETVRTTTRTIKRNGRSETIVEEVRERSNESSRDSSSTTVSETIGGLTTTTSRSESGSESNAGELVGRTVEQRFFDQDITEPDEDFAVRIRFNLPHPFVRKALLKRARARVGLATAVLNSAQHELAIAVRKAYARAVATRAELQAAERIHDTQNRLAGELAELGTWAKEEDLIDLEDEAYAALVEVQILEQELAMDLAQLAALVGISDAGRISLNAPIAPRQIAPSALDPDYLTGVAEAYRGDFLELTHKIVISERENDAENARKIPWVTFIDGFYGIEHDQGYRSSDSFGVQVGVTLPLFTWFKNKRHEVFEQELKSLNHQAASVRNQIQREITLAITNLQRAQNQMAEFNLRSKRHEQRLREALKKAEQGGVQSNSRRLRIEESLAKYSEKRPDLYKNYNSAILLLEKAIGTTLEEVLSAEGSADQPSAAAPARDTTPLPADIPDEQSVSPDAAPAPPSSDKGTKRATRAKPPHRRR